MLALAMVLTGSIQPQAKTILPITGCIFMNGWQEKVVTYFSLYVS
jgi:hypothetical protein